MLEQVLVLVVVVEVVVVEEVVEVVVVEEEVCGSVRRWLPPAGRQLSEEWVPGTATHPQPPAAR